MTHRTENKKTPKGSGPQEGRAQFTDWHSLVDCLSEAVLVINAEGTIVAANASCEHVLGTSARELTGCNFYRTVFAAPALREEVEANGRQAITGNRVRSDVRCRRPRTGACFDAELSISPLTSQGETRLVVEIRDIGWRKKNEQRLQMLATTDPLTRALNRRSFMDTLRYEITRARRYRDTLSLLLVDIDDFKKFNDSFGHDVGDRVLTTFADITRGLLRESDSLGRLGGEEFAVLLPRTDLAEGETVAERIRQATADATVDTLQAPLSFSVSIGIAEARGAALVAESLLKRADAMMYKAKRAGKNRIETDSCRHLRGGRVVKLHAG